MDFLIVEQQCPLSAKGSFSHTRGWLLWFGDQNHLLEDSSKRGRRSVRLLYRGPNFVTECDERALVGWIKCTVPNRLDEQTSLTTLMTEHDNTLDGWMCEESAFCGTWNDLLARSKYDHVVHASDTTRVVRPLNFSSNKIETLTPSIARSSSDVARTGHS
jgi:hypothetical protein